VARLKFHIDENLSNAVAFGLRRRGVDVTTTPEQNLIAASDVEQLAFCLSEGRVLVTNDEDFLKLNAQRVEHCGIVYVTNQRMPIGKLVNKLVVMRRTLDSGEMTGQVQFL
jgi:predicted nuclease of predicted toxin-antitoxin system